MTYAEAVKIVESLDLFYAENNSTGRHGEATEALAVLAGLAEENERLRAFYGNPENISVVADQLHVEVLEKETAALKATLAEIEYYGESPTMYLAKVEAYTKLEAEHETLKAEVEQDKALIADLTRDMNEEHDRAEKAEAELERARPLLEAVEKACPEYLQGELMDLKRMVAKSGEDVLSDSIPILRAALAYKEKANG
jgi:predicted RNase H-like nuclease (RuvC/YqgF family)